MNDAVERILQWPKETRSPREEQQLVEHRRSVYAEIRSLVDMTERADRGFTEEESEQYGRLQAEYDRLTAEVPSAP